MGGNTKVKLFMDSKVGGKEGSKSVLYKFIIMPHFLSTQSSAQDDDMPHSLSVQSLLYWWQVLHTLDLPALSHTVDLSAAVGKMAAQV